MSFLKIVTVTPAYAELEGVLLSSESENERKCLKLRMTY